MPGGCRVILTDDFNVLRNELKAMLEQSEGFSVVGEADNGFELLNLLRDGVIPDIVVLDLVMPTMTGLEALDELRRMRFDCKVLVLTMHKEPEFLCRAFNTGANGYMLKDGIAKEFLSALHTVQEGKIYVSPSINGELLDTCRIKTFAGQELPPTFAHCK